ncbi:hypothetical protein JTB14_038070 [Gonioctena quinquepunctata]|nr:hypothetical protein JTB14_038070 [Gonioctena quinquepunctata]
MSIEKEAIKPSYTEESRVNLLQYFTQEQLDFSEKATPQDIEIEQDQGDKPRPPPATLEETNTEETQAKNLEKPAGKIVQIDGTTELSSEDEASETSDNLKMRTAPKRRKVRKIKRSISQNTPAKSEQNSESTLIHGTGKEPTPIANGKPLPIILEGKNITKGNLGMQIKGICKKGYYINFLNNGTQIHIANQLELGKVKEILIGNKMGFHTYPQDKIKENAHVLKGRDDKETTEEVKIMLKQEHNLETIKVYKMRITMRMMFLVVTDETTTLENLKQKITIITNRKVTWGTRRAEVPTTLCRKCQRWGHTALFCNQTPRCVKCALNHNTNECKKNENIPAKCANCGNAHPANYKGCDAYEQALINIGKQPQGNNNGSRTPTLPLGGQGGSAPLQQEMINNTRELPELETGSPPRREVQDFTQILEIMKATNLLKFTQI